MVYASRTPSGPEVRRWHRSERGARTVVTTIGAGTARPQAPRSAGTHAGSPRRGRPRHGRNRVPPNVAEGGPGGDHVGREVRLEDPQCAVGQDPGGAGGHPVPARSAAAELRVLARRPDLLRVPARVPDPSLRRPLRHRLRLGALSRDASLLRPGSPARRTPRARRVHRHDGGRARHHGGGEPGSPRGRGPLGRLQHRAARRSSARTPTWTAGSRSGTSTCGRSCW